MSNTKSHHKRESEKIFSPAQKRLASSLKKRHPSLSNRDMPELFDGIKRFTRLVLKINNEPQAKVLIKEWKKNKKRHTQKIISLKYDELLKITGKGKPFIEVFQELNDKYDPKRK